MNTSEMSIPNAGLSVQKGFAESVKSILEAKYDHTPRAFVHTYGCQGNVSDSERIKGMLHEMGYVFTDSPEDADLVLFNTCAVREHAEDRVFGNVGALKNIKENRRDMIIALCGCMMQQPRISDKIKRSYPYVNLVFGTFAFPRLPEMLYRVLQGKRVFEVAEEKGKIVEGLPTYRDRAFKSWLPIMYGCDNFCSYCIVPYVRGRERSRRPEDILAEAKQLIADGAKDITLLGQNVNSYGKGLDIDINFAKLLKMINDLPGNFVLRFMTSHPKDCSKELLDTMAECEKVERHLHLPFQSGNNRVLREMNRRYTAQEYIALTDYAKSVMPDIAITSDVIVGFPGETYEEFQDTLRLIERVQFTSLYTFIYSRREGTVAAKMPDPVTHREKAEWMRELLDLQESIAAVRTAGYVGETKKVLVEEWDGKGILVGRTNDNITIQFPGDESLIGTFQNVKVTEALSWIVKGELQGE